ncbi:MAG: hypothetical protein HQM10_19070 [Candidatus Riflebacteria bacterium]|nr:hypothetical protein [Candidatus Riflebacteria bacterium]
MRNKSSSFNSGILFFFCLFFLTNTAFAEKFDFYYQRIDKILEINNPKPDGWFEHAKAFLKGGVNTVKRWVSDARYSMGIVKQGDKTWYSSEDHNVAYQVYRVKVTSREQLIELMGAKSFSELNDGQKALVAMYDYSKTDSVKERTDFFPRETAEIILTDTENFNDEEKYPNIRRDFWPTASGKTIWVNSLRYSYPNSDKDSPHTFTHELAHIFDNSPLPFNAYGKDGAHYFNEKTSPRTAFKEGWAQFNELSYFGTGTSGVFEDSDIKKIKIEDTASAGNYVEIDAASSSLSGNDLLSVEGVNAFIMYDISLKANDGRKKIYDAFKEINFGFIVLKDLLKKFLKKYPDDSEIVFKAFDNRTLNKFSNDELIRYFGQSPQLTEYLARRPGKTPANTIAGSVTPATASNSSGILRRAAETYVAPSVMKERIKVLSDSKNPFTEK